MEHTGENNESRPIIASSRNSYNSIGPQGRNFPTEAETGYTELLRGSVPCPTCRGLGNVPKEQEGQLIALIPMRDERLRPRRTILWVCLAVFLCLLTAGLLLFFLFPRSVDMSSSRPYLNPSGPVYVNITEKYVRFTLINRVNVSNQNFVPLRIRSMKMSVLYDTQVIKEVTNSSALNVHLRSQTEYYVIANITLDNENQMGYMAESCTNPIRWAHEMVMLFQFTCSYETFGHSEQTTLETFQFVSCYSNEKPTTTAAPNTTTTTTTARTTTTTTKKPALQVSQAKEVVL